MANPENIKILKATVPKDWKPYSPGHINRFFNKLPIVADLDVIDKIDRGYEYLNLKASLKR